ncbi:MAG: hypothetical protein EOO43_00115 [Flavobacterium sp.]|nr:MAG: hypothetical protein EOO43_00115 [Flavobacterium sp.]
MTDEILKSFSINHFPFSNNSKLSVKVITDLLDRTNDFSKDGNRNSFTQLYISKLKSTIKNGNTRTNTYKLNDYVMFVFEQQQGDHLIERFNIAFPNEQRNYETLVNLLRKDANLDCIDAANNTFVTRINQSASNKFELEEKFNPVYSGQGNIHSNGRSSGITYTEGSQIQSYGNSVGFSRRYKHLGIGQMKIAIQAPSGGSMSIGITISNVFNRIAEARERICTFMKQLYRDSAVKAEVKTSEEIMVINFNDNQLVENSSIYHKILNTKSRLSGNQSRAVAAYSYDNFIQAKEWKQALINHFFKDCKSMDANLIGNCIDCGIAKIEYTIGGERICAVKLL